MCSVTRFLVAVVVASAVSVGLFAGVGLAGELLLGVAGGMQLMVILGGLYSAGGAYEMTRCYLRDRREFAAKVADIRARGARGESITFHEAEIAGIE